MSFLARLLRRSVYVKTGIVFACKMILQNHIQCSARFLFLALWNVNKTISMLLGVSWLGRGPLSRHFTFSTEE